jgi:RNA polymerase sigma-70 factor (ECF subfamily)
MEKRKFETWYNEYFPTVYRRCLELLRNHEEAENAANTVFEKILKTDKPIEYPKSYLYKMATNMGINLIKKRRKEILLIYAKATNISLNCIKEKEEGEIKELLLKNANLNDRNYHEKNDESYEQIEAEIFINAILKEDDEITRDIYFYRYHDHMTLEQIWEIVGLSKSAVENRLKKIVNKLRQYIEKESKL